MPSILKRDFAPISDAAWAEIDSQAATAIRDVLVGRRLVDTSGPHGWELAAVNLGRVQIAAKKVDGNVGWGLRQVQPLAEVWIRFELAQMELDNLVRGAADADIDALLDAAARAAMFEDKAVLEGFADAEIEGLAKASAHKAVSLPADAEGYPKAVAAAVKALSGAGIGGPYALVLGTDAYFTLMQAAKHGYPPHQAVREILGGPVLRTPVMEGGLVVSTRGGDFELTVGKDFSVGYASHDSQKVGFFLVESFTFRVLEPKAAVPLKRGSK